MKAGLLVVCLVAVAHAMPNFDSVRAKAQLRFDPYDQTWEQFKKDHAKMYGDEETESLRRKVFMDNVKKMEQHNWEYFQGTKSYYLGINQFADMTFEEYRQYNKLQKKPAESKDKRITCSQFLPPMNWFMPASVNWTAKGFVTPVKNQGQCGSCWSFSTTGSLEGQLMRETGKLVSLSEQQLVDCSSSFGNEGCNGGLMDNAFEYINSVGGLESEQDYPYKAEQMTCKFDPTEVKAKVVSCKDVPAGSEKALAQAVASVGPVSVAIDAGHQSFQLYKGGVYDEPECSSQSLDHGVLAVGYGSLEGQEYWLVKNSWSPAWGELGYILMSRNKDNQCGIATSASFPEE